MSAASSPRVSLWEWTQTGLLAANLAWTTLCLGGYRPETMAVTAALTGVLLAVHFFARALAREAAPQLHPAGWLFVPFLIYGAANVHWVTPVRWLGWCDWIWWAQMLAVFWVGLNGIRSRVTRRFLFGTIVLLGVVAVALACYQRFVNPDWLMLGRVQSTQYYGRASGVFGIPNSLAAFLLLLIPATVALALRPRASAVERVLWGWFALVLGFGLVLTISRGAWIALVLALTAWPLVAGRISWGRRLVFTAVVFGVVVATIGTLYTVSPKVRERLDYMRRDTGEKTRPIMWRGAWDLWREKPAWGTGAGSYNVRFEQVRPEGFGDQPQWVHNDYLNTLSDYGAVGFTLFFGAAAAIAARCIWLTRKNSVSRAVSLERGGWFEDRIVTQALAVGLLAFALQLFVDFHFKIPALAMTFALLAAMVVARCWPVDPARATAKLPRRMAFGAAAALALAWAFSFAVPKFGGEALRNRARQRIDALAGATMSAPIYREHIGASRSELAKAVAIDPANAQAWADVAYGAALWARLIPEQVATLGAEAEAAAGNALALAPGCPEFWIRRGVARDMQGRWAEGGTDFSRATQLAPAASWVWFYLADHLSRRDNEYKLAEAALALCLRLDPGNPDGIALRQRLAISHKTLP